MALVIERSKTVQLGGGQAATRQSFTLAQDIGTQGAEDLRQMIQAITLEQIAVQERLDNPLVALEVDGQSAKPLAQVQRRTVSRFGSTLTGAAMRLVETALAAAIAKVSTARSGRLGNISANWQWVYLSKAGRQRVTPSTPPKTFAITDRLILMPVSVPYATNVNQTADGIIHRGGHAHATAAAGKLQRTRRVRHRGAAAKGSAVGFLETATAALKRAQAFKGFTVYAAFTQQHAQQGELSKRQGTPMIVIRPRLRGRLWS
jgi:hypothetical protein